MDAFPKTRPPLSMEQQAIALEAQKMNRSGGNVAAKASKNLEGWMHRKVADRQGGVVLEIGGGTLNHVCYEKCTKSYDVVEPTRDLYEGMEAAEGIRHFYNDISEIPRDQSYDRIISIAVLEHLTDLPLCLAKAGLHLEAEGFFQAGIPSEGGFLWGLAQRMTTGIMFKRRYGLDYMERVRHEHVNNAREIVLLVKHFFREVKSDQYPFPCRHLSFYHYIEACRPDIDECRKYLKKRDSL